MADTRVTKVYQQVYELVKTNQKPEASRMLAGLINKDPTNADLWYIATFVTDDKDKRIAATKRALALNPYHEKAKSLLNKLQPLDDIDALLFSEPASVPIEVQEARRKDYTNAVVFCFLLYLMWWVPGVIATDIYYHQALRMEKLAGHSLPGVGALKTLRRVMFILFVFVVLLFAIIVFLPPILARL